VAGIRDALQIAKLSLTPEQEQEFQVSFLQYIVPELRTPRLAKLYANSVAFIFPMLANEINPVDLLMLEAVRCLYPQIHESIRKFPRVYTGDFGWDVTGRATRDEKAQEQLQGLLEQIGASEAEHAKGLIIQLFPQLRGLLDSGRYGENERAAALREQRVALLDYLQRYLTCSIPAGDISDQEIEGFLSNVTKVGDDELDEQFRRLITPKEEEKVLMKLKSRIADIPLDVAEQLCFTIARQGGESLILTMNSSTRQ
jgi:predicted KAP-like P-loop ATPase